MRESVKANSGLALSPHLDSAGLVEGIVSYVSSEYDILSPSIRWFLGSDRVAVEFEWKKSGE